ncbi:peptidyl-prolyl cis-trans isomerase [Lacrimispora sp.]|uniref:peptidylprolyl isomerase n=1 Tax=Lacrimispora sp. TaxID=2719234 RepID=UPI003460D8D2
MEDDKNQDSKNSDKDEGSALRDFFHVVGFRQGKKKTESKGKESWNLPDIPDGMDSDGPVALWKGREKPCKKRGRKLVLAAVLMAALGISGYLILRILEPEPPVPEAVASYNGKNLTVSQLIDFIAMEGTRSQEHTVCDTHGYDHSKCGPDEPCEQHPVDSLEEYRYAVQMMAVEQIILEWAESEGITAREEVQHGIKDLIGDESVKELLNKIHQENITSDSVSKWEIQQYYDKNKETYKDRGLSEVEEEIRSILLAKKDEEYFPDYINKLKESAGLQVDFDLLKVSEPAREEILEYYQKNPDQYRKDPSASVKEIRIENSAKASEAVKKLKSGETFEKVAEIYAIDGKENDLTVEISGSGSLLETTVSPMSKGEISDYLANEDGTYSIIKMEDVSEAGTQTLDEVEVEIKEMLLSQAMDRQYTLKKDEALFSVHSKRYTLGDFYTEFKELPAEYQRSLNNFDNKKELLEQLIAKELLLEETGDISGDTDKQHEFEELKIQYVSQVMHKEEVDEKLEEASEEEKKEYYEKNKSLFQIPARIKLSLIWIKSTEGQKDQARQKAKEAMGLIDKGTDFAQVAKQYSEDGTAEAGGEMEDWFYQGYLAPELDSSFFSLKPDEISPVIESQGGLYIVKVREKEERRIRTYEESAEEIAAHIKEQNHIELEKQMEKKILEKAKLTIYDKTLRNLLKERLSTWEEKKKPSL